ncbi:histidine--tRNA ligase, cytoplasmic-like [Bidens hawaiensis]|uniref:histidine--tRNA ligase, cytoplasmic-like n=1 Tax=Bidens hawaiensis TaxID=980011 RepID=UPI00404A0E5E
MCAISAIINHAANTLVTIANAVAAVSCEALKADTSTFSLFTDSGDGVCDKDRVSVASEFKTLLKGSNLNSGLKFDEVVKIPIVHGRLRGLCKSVRLSTRVEMNSRLHGVAAGEDLTSCMASLVCCLLNVGESSRIRAKYVVEGLPKDEKFSNLVNEFAAGCPVVYSLDSFVTFFDAFKKEKDYINFLHQIYNLSEAVREILSWEATVSFVSLDGSELIQRLQNDTNGANVVPEKKKDKNKKKVVGKGTTLLMQLFAASTVTDASSFQQGFLSLFDTKSSKFESLLQIVNDAGESRRLPKIPKGTRDFAKEQMVIREKAFSIITNVFKRHGAMALDTPVFELRETLTEKYGEDSKLIYDLADQGGELCSLRYDLTVPFARFVAMKGLTSFRRYQIAKVYRRDNPSKGRYREFYQCDFDIAGDNSIGAEFEVVKILTDLLDELNIGAYEIKSSHRKLLDGILEICGVPSHKIRTVCSSIDKLDKQSFDKVKKELIEEKGLDAKTVEKIGSYVTKRSIHKEGGIEFNRPFELLSELKKEGSELMKNNSSIQALNDLDKLFQALDSAGCVDKVVLDLSLVRGLDYYTGVIYEAVFKGTTQVGSIAAGGRYNNIIEKFCKKHVPAIGVSLGIERVLTIMEDNQKVVSKVVRASETQVLVSILGNPDELLPLAAKLVSMCWNAKLKAEFMVDKRFDKHDKHAKKSGIPWMVIVGDKEINKGIVKLKNEAANIEKDQVPISNFVDELISLMNT